MLMIWAGFPFFGTFVPVPRLLGMSMPAAQYTARAMVSNEEEPLSKARTAWIWAFQATPAPNLSLLLQAPMVPATCEP